MRPSASFLVFILWLAMLAGCATVSFKAGASPDAMAADESACRKATSDEAGYLDCMRKRGWVIRQPDAAPEPPPVGAPASAVPSAQPEAAAPAGTSLREQGAASRASAPVPAPVTPAPLVAGNTATTGTEKMVSTATPAASDPMARVEAASWWRFGGTSLGLNRSVDDGVAKLGPEHRPDRAVKVVTAAMHSCLRSDGWYAYGR